MPPNHPLPDIFVTGRPSRSDYRVITPRTPHSRAGRAEEGFTEVELQAYQDDEPNGFTQPQEQSQPLLSPGYRSQGDDHDTRAKGASTKYWAQQALSKLPLVGGSVLALVLLVSIGVSLKKPGALEAAILGTPGEVLEVSDLPTSSMKATPASPPQSTMGSLPTRPYISYENYTDFPLTGEQYRAECWKLVDYMGHGTYWDPPHKGPLDVAYHSDGADSHMPEGGLSKVCSSTITYMLDGHVGLTADLALMAQAAAFARDRNRTFLVDDTHWNRGKWTDHFQSIHGLFPGPEPGCRAPPPEELVACPRTARHWVLSSETAKFHMGHAFGEEFEDPYSHHLNRFKPIYESSQASFEKVIRPNSRVAALIREARQELVSILSVPQAPTKDQGTDAESRDDNSQHLNNPALYVGVHIRRGDHIPGGYPFYPDKKVPLQKFADGARSAWTKFFGNESSTSAVFASTDYEDVGDAAALRDVSSGREDHFPAAPIMWLASDSPLAAREFVARFSSATATFSLEHSTNADLRALAPVHEYVQAEFNEEPLEERIRLTKGMIVDLAMVSGLWAWPGEVVPGAVVCGVGSDVCKLAALGFGFERAFGFDDDGDYYNGDPNPARARWVDVDVEGRIVPAWKAFSFS